jgi:AbrB family looped-hinge helix DNA binding protein
MRITTKGQVTIPAPIRDRLGLLPHSEVDFEVVGNVVRLRKAATSARGRRIIGRLRGRGDVKMTTEEILALTRG